jgi:hypothetical protein
MDNEAHFIDAIVIAIFGTMPTKTCLRNKAIDKASLFKKPIRYSRYKYDNRTLLSGAYSYDKLGY